MHGAAAIDDTRYAVEIGLMREMRWSWDDLQNAPADLVEMLIERIAAERHWESERLKLQRAMQK